MKSEKGFSLIEVMIAMALLGLIAVTFLGALATSSRAIFIADERATAESLARSEMEYVRSQKYSVAPWAYELPSGTSPIGEFPTWWDEDNPHSLPEGYDGYTVNVSTVTIHEISGHPVDDGIQKIIVVITHLDKEIFTLENYRSWR